LSALQLVAGVEKAWRVEDDHLLIVGRANADDAVASGLRLLTHDAQLLPHDAVEECGFARVGLSDDGDDSGARHEDESRYDASAQRRIMSVTCEV
jgi:hypothetical protein